jgi:NhaA family Na+:H+ antiporter
MATDTAFVIGCLALLGPRIPSSLRVFMLSLAIVDDIGAILIVAIGYSSGITWWLLAAAGVGVATIRTMAIIGLRGFPIYVLLGAVVWAAVDASGIHATITGVVLGLLTPARRWVSDARLRTILNQVIVHPTSEERSGHTPDRNTLRLAERAAREALAPAERLEMALHPWVGFVIMPVFALANAGMPFRIGSWSDPVTIAVVIGFVLGKPVGILLFAWLAIRCRFAALPADLDWRVLTGGGILAGIGFTMALFIANLAFESTLLDSAKLGILVASVTAALAGIALLAAATRSSAKPVSTRGT